MDWPTSGPEWLQRRTIFLTRAGSYAYGTNLPGSDLDVRGIAVAPRKFYTGFANRFEQLESLKPIDMVVFEIQKFFRLASKCNPNALEIIFSNPRDHLLVTPYGQMILDQKELFLSRQAKDTFVGYALGQLRRLTSKVITNGEGYTPELNKHAMHIVRLLRTGKELIETGTLNVFRHDRDELLDIRHGKWTYDYLYADATAMVAEIDKITESSPLSVAPDLDALDSLCQTIVDWATSE